MKESGRGRGAEESPKSEVRMTNGGAEGKRSQTESRGIADFRLQIADWPDKAGVEAARTARIRKTLVFMRQFRRFELRVK
jgi:hypothetical protein